MSRRDRHRRVHARRWVTTASIAAFFATSLAATGSLRAEEPAAPPFPHGDPQQIVATACVACHGQDGNSAVPIFPKLAGQQEIYLAKQLNDYLRGRRENPVMQQAIANLSRSDVPGLAAYFAGQRAVQPAAADDPALAQRGRDLFERGNVDAGIPACRGCHESQAQGDGRYARLAGQSAMYLAQTLGEFKAGTRHNDPARVMRNAAAHLDDDDMKALAAYLASR